MRSPTTITGLSLRKKSSRSNLASDMKASDGLDTSAVPATPANTSAKKKLEIGAPTGMTKKSPEEVTALLRQLAAETIDLPSIKARSSPSPSIRVVKDADKDVELQGGREKDSDGFSEVQRGKMVARADSAGSESTFTSTPTTSTPFDSTRPPAKSAQLSDNQLGKLPAQSPSPTPTPTTFTPEQAGDRKPARLHKTPELDKIRATIPPPKKEDRLSEDEIEGELASLTRGFALLQKFRKLKDAELEQKLQDLTETHLRETCGDNDEEVGEQSMDDHTEEVDEEDDYVWGEDGEPDPRFVDGGWCQEEGSSRWFQFTDTENIIGGPRCPLTHASPDDTEDEGVSGQEGMDRTIVVDNEVEVVEEGGSAVPQINQGFLNATDFDEDAKPLTMEDVWKGEQMF